ncbi:hypothetical protein [Polaribacter sp.]|uniref:hypothetical protein n=1 Tax=Polaribacter sp. TaxID=1920175 RepID=UPI003F4C13BA
MKNTNKEMMFENFKKYLGNNYYMKDSFESNINTEVFKNIRKFDFNIKNVSERPIEVYFIEYLNEVASKNGIVVKYVILLTLHTSLKEYEYYPRQLYNLGIKRMHKYDEQFLKSIYRKENFVDHNHLNIQEMELFYNEVFN